MATPRIYLFHGNDSFRSGRMLQHWRQRFEEKYGLVERIMLEADELSANELQQALHQALIAQGLFGGERLVVIKRLTTQEKGLARALSKTVLAELESAINYLDGTTIVLWEAKQLGAEHSLVKQFQTWERASKAKIILFTVPTTSRLSQVVESYMADLGTSLEPAAFQLLSQQYDYLGRLRRLVLRLKADEIVVEDDRSWWLAQILESAASRADNGVITASILQDIHRTLLAPLGIFTIVEAWLAGATEKVQPYLAQLRLEGEEDRYLQLLAALRWQINRQMQQANTTRLQRLLGEVELIQKNFSIEMGLLLELAYLRWMNPRDDNYSIISSRKLWLAHLART